MTVKIPAVWYSGFPAQLQAGDSFDWTWISGEPTTLAGYGITDAAALAGASFTGAVSVDSGGGSATTTRTLRISNSTQWFDFIPNISAGGFNTLAQAGDHALIFSNNASGTGAMVIASWGTGAGIRLDSAGTIAFQGTINGLATTNTLASSVTDLSKQLALWGNYGFSITTNRLNNVVPTGAGHYWTVNGVDIANVTGSGLFYGGVEVGYRGIPMTLKNAAYTFTTTDKGKGIYHSDTTARAYTVPTGFTQGDVLTVANETGTGACTIVPGAGMTMYLAGTATTGTRTLAVRGIATIYIGASGTSCYVSGPGVT